MNNFVMLWKDKADRVSKKANIAHPVTRQSIKNTCNKMRKAMICKEDGGLLFFTEAK